MNIKLCADCNNKQPSYGDRDVYGNQWYICCKNKRYVTDKHFGIGDCKFSCRIEDFYKKQPPIL